jgi:hypothetical protein
MYEKEKSEILRLKQHLLSIPSNLGLASDSVAIRAAIAGLDKELSRLGREEKLMQRFKAASDTTNEKASKSNEDDVDMEYVKMSKADASDGDVHDDKEEEWMDATASNSDEAQQWASSTIARISSGNVKVETALGALGLVLHGALMELSATGGGDKFKCTGVPAEDVLYELSLSATSKQGGKRKVQYDGFAPPVRELPNGQLVPPKWEEACRSTTPHVSFRYKSGRGEYSTDVSNTDASTLYLIVEPIDDQIAVYFGPLCKEIKRMTFKLDSYVNLDGMRAALEKGSPASPLLFYKSLKELLLLFSNEFGLEHDMKCTFGESVSIPIKNVATVETVECTERSRMHAHPDIPTGPAVATEPSIDPLRVDSAHTGGGRRGDFEGDLLPGGLRGPDITQGPIVGGSQVGPNHPLFDRTFGDDDINHGYGDDLGFDESGPSFRVPGTGGFEMRPRFDPFGPPGGPTEPGRGLRGGRGRGRGGGRGRGTAPPGGFGFPNPDHMRPPGGDYFG